MKRRDWCVHAAALAAWPAASVWPGVGAWAATPAPQRIVSVGGAITETVYAVGAQSELVGVDTTSLYPATATRLPGVGYARALSAEGVLSLRPTLVLAGAEAGPPAVLRQIEAAGPRLILLDADHRVEGLFQRTQRIAEACGRVAVGRALVATLQQDWAATSARVARQRQAASLAGTRPPRVLFVLSHDMAQLRVAGRNTAADAMLVLAGATNALGGFEGYKPLTPEAVIAAAPDIVLATDQGVLAAGGADGLLAAPGLALTPAGRQRRLLSMDALLLLGFGPRLPQAVAALADGLHGKTV
jgi:iron complex transport system substrate-binding protein